MSQTTAAHPLDWNDPEPIDPPRDFTPPDVWHEKMAAHRPACEVWSRERKERRSELANKNRIELCIDQLPQLGGS